jgi:hypothetical protein
MPAAKPPMLKLRPGAAGLPAIVPTPPSAPPQALQRGAAVASQATSQASASADAAAAPTAAGGLPPPACWAKLFMKSCAVCTPRLEKPA